MTENLNYWKKCSACKKEIPFKAKYYVCSVSTCNGQRTGYAFCSISCFERHLPGARHKDAAAVEKIADSVPAINYDERSAHPPVANSRVESTASSTVNSAASSPTNANEPRTQQRILIRPGPPTNPSTTTAPGGRVLPKEILVIASRFKEYIAAKGDMNTSGDVMEVLSDYLRVIADRAIDEARAQGRKTVMERDLQFLKKS